MAGLFCWRQRCPRASPISRVGSPATPRPCAGIIFPTDAGRGATGSRATSTTIPAAASMSGYGPEAGKGAAGKWTDAAAGEHGDLLDLIAGARRLATIREVIAEARRFLSLPSARPRTSQAVPAPTGSPEAARRLFAMARPIRGTLAETYLRRRSITFSGKRWRCASIPAASTVPTTAPPARPGRR